MESKDLRLLFVSALNSGHNARRSSLNLHVCATPDAAMPQFHANQ
jgi:hypothetical protein